MYTKQGENVFQNARKRKKRTKTKLFTISTLQKAAVIPKPIEAQPAVPLSFFGNALQKASKGKAQKKTKAKKGGKHKCDCPKGKCKCGKTGGIPGLYKTSKYFIPPINDAVTIPPPPRRENFKRVTGWSGEDGKQFQREWMQAKLAAIAAGKIKSKYLRTFLQEQIKRRELTPANYQSRLISSPANYLRAFKRSAKKQRKSEGKSRVGKRAQSDRDYSRKMWKLAWAFADTRVGYKPEQGKRQHKPNRSDFEAADAIHHRKI